MLRVLTWVSANELRPGALLGGEGVGGANQLVLGHLGVGFGELQPKGLRDLRIKPDPLRSDEEMCKHKYCFLAGFEVERKRWTGRLKSGIIIRTQSALDFFTYVFYYITYKKANVRCIIIV